MKKQTITQVILFIALIVAALFGADKQLELSSISETITTLQEEKQQLQQANDSLFRQNLDAQEKIQVLVRRNSEVTKLNRQLSQLASKKQKVKYVTSSQHLQTIKDSLDIVFNNLLYQRLTVDSLKEQLQITSLEAEKREMNLWEALTDCYENMPQYPFVFQKEDDYINYTVIITSDSTATVDIITRDTLNFAHTTQRNGFLGLGKKTYNIFAESASPYATTRTHSYIFKNEGIFSTHDKDKKSKD